MSLPELSQKPGLAQLKRLGFDGLVASSQARHITKQIVQLLDKILLINHTKRQTFYLFRMDSKGIYAQNLLCHLATDSTQQTPKLPYVVNVRCERKQEMNRTLRESDAQSRTNSAASPFAVT